MSLNEIARHNSGPRVLVDQTQRRMKPQHTGRSAYRQRLDQPHVELLGSSQASKDFSSDTEIHTLGQSEALARVSASRRPGFRETPQRSPARLYRPLDQHPALPQFDLVCRERDVVLAKVRGDLEYVEREARRLAAAWGVRLRDLKIVIASH